MNDTAAPPPAPTPPADDGKAPAPPSADAGALALAEAAMVPFIPGLGVRCPRCGERLEGKPEDPCQRCRVIPRSADAARALVAKATPIREALRGALYLPRGFLKILITPRLWKHAAIPLLINIVIVVIAWWAVHHFVVDWLVRNTTSADALPEWTGYFWGALRIAVRWMGWFAAWFTFIIAPIIAAWLITGPLSVFTQLLFAPFMDILSRETETVQLGADLPAQTFDFKRFQADLVTAVIDIVLIFFLKIIAFVILLVIAVIPVIGPIVWLVTPAVFSGIDWTDIHLVRKRYSFREKLALWKARSYRFVGFGAAVWFFLNIPFVNWLVVPAAAAGGCLLYLESDRK